MKIRKQSSALVAVALLLAMESNAFTTPFHSQHHAKLQTHPKQGLSSRQTMKVPSLLRMASDDESSSSSSNDDIDRLRSEAARLRAEAAALEAKQAEGLATAAERAFQKFDTDKDGEISLQELKAGLEKTLKLEEIPEDRVKKLMENFDKSGDGTLQLSEFVGVDQFRNKLDALAREERANAIDKTNAAKQEAQVARMLEEQVAKINDRPPTSADKVLSVLPYLLPFLDGLQYASFLLLQNQENPIAIGTMLLYTVFRSIPFSGFVAFFALISISGRPGINRLIRFNTQQAIYLDIALFFPGLLTALVALAGVQIDPTVAEVTNNAIFFTLMSAILYSTISSLLGAYPDKIPLISAATEARVPSAEKILKQNKDFLDVLMKGGDLPNGAKMVTTREMMEQMQKKKKEEEKEKEEQKKD